ncbi:hypothetical protein BMAJHU_I0061 [Burkholderia mallei JHU]|nr:hypothetical protein BMAJHU_I0061 [Burkholderia mallei JHU]
MRPARCARCHPPYACDCFDERSDRRRAGDARHGAMSASDGEAVASTRIRARRWR